MKYTQCPAHFERTHCFEHGPICCFCQKAEIDCQLYIKPDVYRHRVEFKGKRFEADFNQWLIDELEAPVKAQPKGPDLSQFEDDGSEENL